MRYVLGCCLIGILSGCSGLISTPTIPVGTEIITAELKGALPAVGGGVERRVTVDGEDALIDGETWSHSVAVSKGQNTYAVAIYIGGKVTPEHEKEIHIDY